MPYISGKKKGELNRCDVKKLYVEKTGESPPVSWTRDKIMSHLENKEPKKVEVKEEPEVVEEVVDEPVQPKKKAKKKKN